MSLELSWILPLYKTSEHLNELCLRVRQTAVRIGVPYEIILVDDACPHGSGTHAERLAEDEPAVRVLRLPKNRGQDGAVREGLRASRGQWAVVLDADLQDPPEAVEQLWSARREGVDVVFADRVGVYTTPGRQLTSRAYRRAVALIAGFPAGACAFVMLNRRLIDTVANTRAYPIAILAAIAAARPTCDIIPIKRKPRPSGRSAYNAQRRLLKATTSLWQVFLARRLNKAL